MFGDWQNRATESFVKNSRVVFDLPLGDKILQGKVVLHGNITIPNAGTTNGVAFGEGGPINLIDRIIMHANPSDQRYPGGEIVDCTSQSLLRFAAMQHHGKFIGEQGGSTLGNGAANTYAIYLSVPIYFADPTLRARDVSTALNTDPGSYDAIQVEIRTADIAACFTGNDRTPVDYSGLSIDWIDRRAQFAGDTNVLFQEDHDFLIQAAQKRAIDTAMPKDGQFLSWLILERQGASQQLASTLLNKLRVEGNPIDLELYAQDITQHMLDDEWLDPSQSSAGMKFIDWTDGVLGQSLTASSLQTRFDLNNPSGANQDSLRIYTRRLFAPAPASK